MMPNYGLKNASKTKMNNVCSECGCNCDSCVDSNSVHLHQEIEQLKSKLAEKEQQIVSMESQILVHANQYPHGEMQALRENLFFWEDKYKRVLESYRKLQKVNQGLEDKLLRIADKFESEKIALSSDVQGLNEKLNEIQSSYSEVYQERDRYKKDFKLAVRLLQNHPSQFMSHNIDSLPDEVQYLVKHYLEINGETTKSDKIVEKNVNIPILTFPPTAVVYSMNKKLIDSGEALNNSNIVSAGLVAEVLEKREIHRQNGNLCLNCKLNPSLMPTHRDYNISTVIDVEDRFAKRPSDETIIV